MSGDYFGYQEYAIKEIVTSIEEVLNRQGKRKPKDELYGDIKYYEEHPEELYYYTYPEIVQEKIKEGIKQLKIAAVYARRIDFLLSSDDSDESFLIRLSEDLNKLKYENKNNNN